MIRWIDILIIFCEIDFRLVSQNPTDDKSDLVLSHYNDVIITPIASHITSLTVVSSTVYSDADQRKHQSSAFLAFVWGIHRDRWIPHTKGQLRGKCFHLMTSSWGNGLVSPGNKPLLRRHWATIFNVCLDDALTWHTVIEIMHHVIFIRCLQVLWHTAPIMLVRMALYYQYNCSWKMHGDSWAPCHCVLSLIYHMSQ